MAGMEDWTKFHEDELTLIAKRNRLNRYRLGRVAFAVITALIVIVMVALLSTLNQVWVVTLAVAACLSAFGFIHCVHMIRDGLRRDVIAGCTRQRCYYEVLKRQEYRNETGQINTPPWDVEDCWSKGRHYYALVDLRRPRSVRKWEDSMTLR